MPKNGSRLEIFVEWCIVYGSLATLLISGRFVFRVFRIGPSAFTAEGIGGLMDLVTF